VCCTAQTVACLVLCSTLGKSVSAGIHGAPSDLGAVTLLRLYLLK
jgi:hypothetical protein